MIIMMISLLTYVSVLDFSPDRQTDRQKEGGREGGKVIAQVSGRAMVRMSDLDLELSESSIGHLYREIAFNKLHQHI